MSLTWLSGSALAAGIAALAAMLFALQRLRVRHREIEVVTTLFWREAIEETRARVLVQRFRHPLAYLLVLAIASLVWFAVAGPRWSGASEREHVLVVDGSAGMAWSTRFADALKAARERANELPRESTRIVLAASRVDTLLDRGEELPLFDRRTASLAPEICPASVQRALFDLIATASPQHRLAIEVFGDAPVDAAALELVRKSADVERADLGAVSRVDAGRVTALGVTEAASGAWDRVDVFASIHTGGNGAIEPRIALDGAPLASDAVVESLAARAGEKALVLRDVPARGGRIDVASTASNADAAGATASVVLPNRPLIRVALSPKTPQLVHDALAADPGVALVAADADVVVRHASEEFGGDAPAIELADDESGPAFVVRRVAVADANDELRESFEELGLSEIDSTALAQESGKKIELALDDGDRRGVALWSSLLDERFDFAAARAFPLFLARSVRWLAEVEPIAPVCAAGERASDGSVGSSRVDLQACKLEYSIVSPK